MSPLLLRQSIGAPRSKNFHLLVSYCSGGANAAVTPLGNPTAGTHEGMMASLRRGIGGARSDMIGEQQRPIGTVGRVERGKNVAES
jgi:hypothetical protein